MVISIFKNEKLIIGNPVKISKIVGMNPETIRRWYREGKKVHANKDYIIFINCEKL